MIAIKNGFESLEKNIEYAISALHYIHLKSGDEGGEIKDIPVGEMIENVSKGVNELIIEYDQLSTPYLCNPNNKIALKYNDYEHLSRINEWNARNI